MYLNESMHENFVKDDLFYYTSVIYTDVLNIINLKFDGKDELILMLITEETNLKYFKCR